MALVGPVRASTDKQEKQRQRDALDPICLKVSRRRSAASSPPTTGPHCDVVRKTKNGLEVARRQGRVGGRRAAGDDDKRAATLPRRERGESIRTIGVGVSVGVVHKTLAAAEGTPTDQFPAP
ncbi:hypothetical protein [Nonomuraea sp. NPDC049684]|uniref:hypothetical protein n=1 Tax=Nonomuraea sp. NPDC049684 TaxID=3364356 RepID=UPI0037963DDB